MWESLKNLVFPNVCGGCHRVGNLICPYCQAQMVTFYPPFVADWSAGFVCIGIHDGPLRQAVHALKFEMEPRLAEPLGLLLTQQIRQQNWSFDTIIPVPLHVNRLRERGYNQAKIIAHALVVENTIVMDALVRTRETSTQVGKSAEARRHNVKDAFALQPDLAQHLVGKQVLLVDDVCTTGATLAACAAPLYEAGVLGIYVATISRAHTTSLI